MKAIQFEHYGEPVKVLTVRECPLPEPGKGEVRVRILASAVNPSDLLFVRGRYAGVDPRFPSPVGFEGVGIVDVLGPQVQRPVPGQRVAVINAKTGGNWADYAGGHAIVLGATDRRLRAVVHMSNKINTSKTVAETADEQPWTVAFKKRSTEDFEAALAPEVALHTSGSFKPIVGRDLVKICMAAASTLYERLDFFAQAKSQGRTWLHWKARTVSGLEIVGVTVLEINAEGKITSIGIHKRPLEAILKFSAELGQKLEGKIDRSYFYRLSE